MVAQKGRRRSNRVLLPAEASQVEHRQLVKRAHHHAVEEGRGRGAPGLVPPHAGDINCRQERGCTGIGFGCRHCGNASSRRSRNGTRRGLDRCRPRWEPGWQMALSPACYENDVGLSN